MNCKTPSTALKSTFASRQQLRGSNFSRSDEIFGLERIKSHRSRQAPKQRPQIAQISQIICVHLRNLRTKNGYNFSENALGPVNTN